MIYTSYSIRTLLSFLFKQNSINAKNVWRFAMMSYRDRERPSNFGLRILNFPPRTSDIRHQTSDFGVRSSDFGFWTSHFGLQTSEIILRTSDFGLPTSDFGLLTSDLTPQPIFYKNSSAFDLPSNMISDSDGMVRDESACIEQIQGFNHHYRR